MPFIKPAYHSVLRVLLHLALFAVSLLCAFLLRFDYTLPEDQVGLLLAGLAISLPVKAACYYTLGLFRGGWRYTAMSDLTHLVKASVISATVFTPLCMLLIGPAFPRSVYMLDCLLTFLFAAAARCGVRLFREAQPRSIVGRKRILIYGAGSQGAGLVREIRSNPDWNYKVVGFLDDSPWKVDVHILGLAVMGTGKEAADVVRRCEEKGEKIDEIVIAMPSASPKEIQNTIESCAAAGVGCKIMPGIGDLLAGKVSASSMKPASMADLLGRAPVQIEEHRVRTFVEGRSVLVTGAAGSIGSELCRQIASFNPLRLIAFDQSESELFRIDNELRERWPQLNVMAEIGDIRSELRVRDVVQRYSIDSIFHAAAYKHVPLMEAHPLEAIRNNIFGTRNLVHAAYDLDVSSFLMISSDKAVRPSSVMGATKRASELMLLSMPRGRTRFVSVRFGNVLGSNGSVIPRFQAQIDSGGPVTVTHPEMRRYFMTIPEAVQLVLLASTMGKGSEVFVLDMGEPVKIVDLASQMIRLSGRIPGRDIQIQFTGIRPGEKLSEELNTRAENMLPTEHDKIHLFQGLTVEDYLMEAWLLELEELLTRGDEAGALIHLRELVHEFEGSRDYAAAVTSA